MLLDTFNIFLHEKCSYLFLRDWKLVFFERIFFTAGFTSRQIKISIVWVDEYVSMLFSAVTKVC